MLVKRTNKLLDQPTDKCGIVFSCIVKSIPFFNHNFYLFWLQTNRNQAPIELQFSANRCRILVFIDKNFISLFNAKHFFRAPRSPINGYILYAHKVIAFDNYNRLKQFILHLLKTHTIFIHKNRRKNQQIENGSLFFTKG